MTTTLPRNLTFRLMVCCAGLALLATLLIGLASYQVRHQQLQQIQQEALAHLLDVSLPLLRQLLEQQQPQLTAGVIDAMTRHPAVASAVLLDETGKILQQSDRLQRHQCQEGLTGSLWFSDPGLNIYPLQTDNFALGKLVIQPDRCYIINSLHDSVIRQLYYALITTLLLAGSLGLLWILLFIRPLQRILRNATASASVAALPAPAQPGNELKHLQQLLSGLQHQLLDQQQRQAQAETTIVEYSRKLEALISKRTDALTLLNRRLQKSRLHAPQPPQRFSQLMQLLQAPLQRLNELIEQHQPAAACALIAQIRLLTEQLNTLQESNTAMTLQSMNLCELSEALLQQCETGGHSISIICDLNEDILLPRQSLSLLLLGLFSNALLRRGHSSLILHLRPLKQQLQISLSGKQLQLSSTDWEQNLLPINTDSLQQPSLIGLALLQELVTLLDGELRLEPYELIGQSLVCILPLRRRSQLQNTLQNYFSRHPLSLRLSDDERRQQTEQWLHNWQIPFTAKTPQGDQILLTDLQGQEHNSELTLLWQSLGEWSESSLMLALESMMQQQPGAASDNINVLLVDDNAINRLLCERYLRNLNVQPQLAENGLQAVEYGHQLRYDLIFMDCRMPIMDGLEATRQLRATQLNGNTPIVALTGLSGDDERQNCLAAGMNDFIGKPFNQEQILAVLMQWVPGYDGQASD